MYNNMAAPAAAGGILAITGGNFVWAVLAAFAMIALGSALARIVPRKTVTR